MRRSASRFLLTALVTPSLLLACASVAEAQTTVTRGPIFSSAAPPAGATRSGLTRTGFNQATALANGFRILKSPNGSPYGWKPGWTKFTNGDGSSYALPPRGTSPNPGTGNVPYAIGDDYKEGDCGYSFIEITGIGDGQAFVTTGFGTDVPAVYIEWTFTVTDALGSGRLGPYKEEWNNNVWDMAVYTNNTPGPVIATVSTLSTIVLANGEVCSSLGPSDYGEVHI